MSRMDTPSGRRTSRGAAESRQKGVPEVPADGGEVAAVKGRQHRHSMMSEKASVASSRLMAERMTAAGTR